MTIYSWIDKLFETPTRRPKANRRCGRRAPPERARRLAHRLESLEDRLVLATFNVTDTTDNPADTGSLRYAINHFASNDTIQFDSSLAGKTIGLTGGQLDISKTVTIIGPAKNQVTIDGLLQSRIFDIHSGDVQIFNLKIERGDAAGGNGGAILNEGTLTLGNLTVSGSMATGSNGVQGNTSANEGSGGGIYNSGTLNLVQSTISGNKSYGGAGHVGVNGSGGGGGGGAALGGGIFNSGTLNMVNSTVSGNTVQGGSGGDFGDPGFSFGDKMGGAGGGNGAFNNTGSYAHGYQVAGFGGGGAGGMGSDQSGNNQNGTNGGFGGGGGGGGAYTLTGLFPSTAQHGSGGSYAGAGGAGGNSFDQYGSSGGAYSGGGGGGAGVGGGIFSKGGTVTITSSTIANNSATGGVGGSDGSSTVKSPNAGGAAGEGVGGGIYIFDGTATLDSTIVAGNSVGGPGGGLSPDARARFQTIFGFSQPFRVFTGTHNLIQDATGASGLTSPANLLNVNPLLLPLADNGGATQTMEPQFGSPAIGAGDPQAVSPIDGSAVKVDQHGVARHAQPFIGSVEQNTIDPHPTISSTGGPYFVATEQSALQLSAKVVDPSVGHALFVRWDINGDGTPDATAQAVTNGSTVTVSASLNAAQLKALGVFSNNFLLLLKRSTVNVTASDGFFTSAKATTTLTTERIEGGIKNNGPVVVGQPVTAQLFVPPGASVQGPLHYSIALNQGDLATTYADAGTGDTQSFTFDNPGSYTAYGRMFQPDGAFSEYATTIDVYVAGQNDAMFVDRMYNHLLGRAGSPNGPDPGPASWAGQLANGAGRQQMALAIMSDAGGEYDDHLVQAAFQQYLHRAADPQALDYFAALLHAGLTAEQLDIDLVGSDEYFSTRGGETNDGFLDALYEDALGRSPDTGGRNSFNALLATTARRSQVADIVFGSPEYQHDLVNNMYELLLNRPADPTGLAGFTAELSAGLTDQQVMAQIIGSEEFAPLA